MEKIFRLKENNTTVKTELIAGLTTFMTMAYILALNPQILSASGMDTNAVLMSTAIASAIGCFAMAFLANYPFALAPGLGLNAYFAYTVCGAMGYSWQFALFAVFVEGLIFIVLSLTNVREAIFDAIPITLKKAVSVGIGLFVAFIGLQDAGVVVDGATLVTIIDFKTDFTTVGICALLALIGFFIISILYIKKVKGSILIGIVVTWLFGIICQLAGLYKGASLLPSFASFDIGAISKTVGQCFMFDFSTIKILDFLVIMCAFLFVDMFDTLGTLVGVAQKADMLDKDGKLPRVKQALLADAIATSVGAVLGTSTTTTYVESASGVAEGGRTGLSAMVTGLLFLSSIILAPIFIALPGFAIAPALLFVGFLMVSSVASIDFADLTESIPAFLCLTFMPLTYSIAEGISVGVISYVVINLLAGKKEKITPLMYVLAVLFVLKYAIL